MSRKSRETIGPNVDIPATTESNAFQHERLFSPSQRGEGRYTHPRNSVTAVVLPARAVARRVYGEGVRIGSWQSCTFTRGSLLEGGTHRRDDRRFSRRHHGNRSRDFGKLGPLKFAHSTAARGFFSRLEELAASRLVTSVSYQRETFP